MGYEVHIARNEEWWDEDAGGGIASDEWNAYVASDETMRLENVAEANMPDGHVLRYENQGLALWVNYSAHDESGNKAWFDFRDGCISVKNPDEEILRKMHQIASQLDARVLGDEGEEYDADGEVIAGAEDNDSLTRSKPWWELW